MLNKNNFKYLDHDNTKRIILKGNNRGFTEMHLNLDDDIDNN